MDDAINRRRGTGLHGRPKCLLEAHSFVGAELLLENGAERRGPRVWRRSNQGLPRHTLVSAHVDMKFHVHFDEAAVLNEVQQFTLGIVGDRTCV